MGFKLDTWPHCLGPTSNPPLIAITVIVIFFAHFCVAAGFLFTHKPLSLYRFPSKFRNEFWGLLLGVAGFFVLARALKQVVLRKQEARYQAMLRSSGGSRLSSARGSLGRVTAADRTVLRAPTLRIQELKSKLRWLTLKAPKIVPLLSGLSTAMTNVNSQADTIVSDPSARSPAQMAHERV